MLVPVHVRARVLTVSFPVASSVLRILHRAPHPQPANAQICNTLAYPGKCLMKP